MCFPGVPPSFYCGWNTTACETGEGLFGWDTETEATGFILRGYQVAPIEDGDPVAILVEPTTTLTPVSGSKSGNTSARITTVTAHASATAIGTTGYSVGDVAGAAAGVGVPFLLALIGAIIYIFSLKRRLRKQQEENQKTLAERPHIHHYASNNTSQSPAPGYFAAPPAAPYTQGGQGGNFEEMQDSGVREIGPGRTFTELDAAQEEQNRK